MSVPLKKNAKAISGFLRNRASPSNTARSMANTIMIWVERSTLKLKNPILFNFRIRWYDGL